MSTKERYNVDADTDQSPGAAILGIEDSEIMTVLADGHDGQRALHRDTRRRLRPPDTGRVVGQPVHDKGVVICQFTTFRL